MLLGKNAALVKGCGQTAGLCVLRQLAGGKEHQLGRETVQELRTGAGRHGDGQAGNGHELQMHGATECQAARGVWGVGRLPPS